MKSESPIPENQVAVVIPAFCAEAHITEVLANVPRFVAWVVVVDDASPDNTAGLVADAAQRDPRIRLLRHDVNQGVGGAVLAGYREAHRLGADIIVKMDSDGQMDPRYLPALIDPIVRGQADYTKGNRYVHARQLRSMPLLRRVGNLGLSFLTKLASGYWNLFDPTNGYTAIHAALIPLLNEDAIARRYFFESSMLLELSLLRAVTRDIYIPANYHDETSHLSVFASFRQFPLALLRGFLRRLWIQYFVRDFSIASLYLVAGSVLLSTGMIFGAFHWYSSARLQVATPTGTVMLAALPVILGVQFLLQVVGLDIQSQPTQCLHRNFIAEQNVPWATSAPPLTLAELHDVREPMPRHEQRAA
jgi:glycosyltransferase involved in cell wall biosynthesis